MACALHLSDIFVFIPFVNVVISVTVATVISTAVDTRSERKVAFVILPRCSPCVVAPAVGGVRFSFMNTLIYLWVGL